MIKTLNRRKSIRAKIVLKNLGRKFLDRDTESNFRSQKRQNSDRSISKTKGQRRNKTVMIVNKEMASCGQPEAIALRATHAI